MNETKERSSFQTGFGPMTDKFIENLLYSFTSGKLKEKLADTVVDPFSSIINKKIRPYLYIGFSMYILLVILLLCIIYLIYKKKI
uniref:Uncharacterized protein n=1 Tax=viral metagenome TaxID=1070528 RepID=A0A6C0LQM4_9ZZZZ